MSTTRIMITADDFATLTTAVVAFETYFLGAPGGRLYSAVRDLSVRAGINVDPQPMVEILSQLPGLLISADETPALRTKAEQTAHEIVEGHAQLLAHSQAGAASLERVIAQVLFEALRGPELPAEQQNARPSTLRDIAHDFFAHNLDLLEEVPRLQQIEQALDGTPLASRRVILAAAMLTLAADEAEQAEDVATEETAERAMNQDPDDGA